MARTWSGGDGSVVPPVEPINWRRVGVVGVCALAALVLLMVGGPAAVASYRHARRVVEVFGDPAMAPWLPLTTDGMLLAALVVMWVRRVFDRDVGRGPWAAFALGLLATLWANVVAAGIPPAAPHVDEWTVVGFFVAVWPPVCLAVSLELLALLIVHARDRSAGMAETGGPDRPGTVREDLTEHHTERPAGDHEAIEPDWIEKAVPGDPSDAVWTAPPELEQTGPFRVLTNPDRIEPVEQPEPERTDERRTGDDAAIREWIRDVLQRTGSLPTRYAVMQTWKGGTGRIDRLLGEVDRELVEADR